MKNYTIDATDKSLGRIASEAATALMGKRSAQFAHHVLTTDTVMVLNASRMKITGAKRSQKMYTRYTGYPGGERTLSLQELVAKKGLDEVVRKAVRGMLPVNKLRAQRLKNLHVTE